MNELHTVCVYNGLRTYTRKDGTTGTIYKFKDINEKEFEMFVLTEVPEMEIGTKVGCTYLFGKRFNLITRQFNIRQFFKSVVPITD